MRTERRLSTRHAITINVALYYDRLGLLPCKTRDLCMEGMFVHTGRVNLSENVPVDAVFTGWQRPGVGPLRLTARIVRVTEGGAALRFHDIEAADYRILRKVLHEA
jgi:hypothetical protein